ncbi:MAG: 4-diphosphocytidyl-2C-methyl-D-erythritol kinase [Candidatus Acidoferrum typicum]|nr:4-diphosphocytidyl-2C-methyl-D-erythritol kinase [Candidatus Acidoferrum typicum]
MLRPVLTNCRDQESRAKEATRNNMLAAVILSGGASSRMGSPKALLAYQGRPFLEHLLEVTVHAKIGVRRVVLGAHAEPIAKSIALAADEIVINADWESGQLSSIQSAIRSLSTKEGQSAATSSDATQLVQHGAQGEAHSTDGFLLCLIDHPLISGALVNELIEVFYASSCAKIVLPIYEGRRGHPVIFPATLYQELLQAPADKGARAVVWAHAPADLLEVPTNEEGCVLNLNDPETLLRATGRSN